MSQWTHVSGQLRIDGIPQLPGMAIDPHSELARIMSHGLPEGSEGGLQWRHMIVGTGLVYLTVPIWGDLRDFGRADCRQIDAWFAYLVDLASDTNLARSRFMLRAAHLLVEVESGPAYVLVLDGDRNVRRINVSGE